MDSSKRKYEYICRQCGKTFTLSKSSIYLRKKKNQGFDLCKYCLRDWKAEKQKMKQTKLERYGSQGYNNREKSKLTCLERYGVDNVTKDETISRSRDLTNVYSDITAQKRNETVRKKYGVDSCAQIPSVVEARLQCYEDDKRKQARAEKVKQTCMERYGVSNAFLLRKQNIPRGYYYDYDGNSFESSWELYYYIYLRDNKIDFVYKPKIRLKYFIDNVEHTYYPDFLVNGAIHEIKGNLFIRNNILYNPYDKQYLYEKTKCLKDNGIIILMRKDLDYVFEYIIKHYGKDYYKKFRRKIKHD